MSTHDTGREGSDAVASPVPRAWVIPFDRDESWEKDHTYEETAFPPRVELLNGMLAPHGLEVRRRGGRQAIFRGDERLTGWATPLKTLVRVGKVLRESGISDLALERVVDTAINVDWLRSCATRRDVRADVVLLLAKKLAPATRFERRMKRVPTGEEWGLARDLQDIVAEGEVPDWAFEVAIREARTRFPRVRSATSR